MALSLSLPVDELVERVREELGPMFEAAVELASDVQELVLFVPGDVSPVVIQRQRIDALRASLDRFRSAASDVLEERTNV